MMTKYVLASDSASDEVIVGDKTLTKNGESVDLTEEEYKSVTSDDSVKLEEEGAQSEQTQEASGQQQPEPPDDQTSEQSGKE